MAKKTNKTSHVMDLLTNGSSEESGDPVNDSAASTDAAAGQEKKGDIQSHTVTPKKVTVVDEGSQNDRLSQEILNKLSEELEQETQPKEPDSTSATESVGDSASSNRTMSPEEIAHVMGLTPRTVYNTTHMAITRLRERLGTSLLLAVMANLWIFN